MKKKKEPGMNSGYGWKQTGRRLIDSGCSILADLFRRFMFYRKNLIVIGIALLLVFGLAVWLIGKKIDHTANQLNRAMLKEVGQFHASLIASDFTKTIELATTIRNYIAENNFHEEKLKDLLCRFVRMDYKISRIWYKYEGKDFVCIDSAGVMKHDDVYLTTLEKLVCELKGTQENKLYYNDGILYWTLYARCGNVVFGIDVSLPGLHSYFIQKSLSGRNYVFVLNGDGIYIAHPDETKIGRKVADNQISGQFRNALLSCQPEQYSGFSGFLLLPVERIYYPVQVGKEKWVVVVNIPNLEVEEAMGDFHHYAFLIILLTVLIFSVLLAVSQYKWRKEYDHRRKLEQEALQMNLQQLKNQVNPHFLFNSLNSLSALITEEPVLAKEFVLRLSKIYRYVLEKRNESLVSVKEEVEFIRHYYFLQRIRFGEQLKMEIAEKLSAEERKIPAMGLQMLIENAIKHNEVTRQHSLLIRIFERDGQLIVENTYHPRKDSSEDSLGIGFENICKVYDYCAGKHFEYYIEQDLFICILPLIDPSSCDL